MTPWGETLARDLTHHWGSGPEKATMSSQHLSQGSSTFARQDGGSPVVPGHWWGERVTWRVKVDCHMCPCLQACSPSGKIHVRSPQVVWQRLGYLLLSMTFSSLRTPTHPLRCLSTVPVKVMPSHLFFAEHLVLMPGLALVLDHNQL